MSTEAGERKRGDDSFWKEFPAMTDYFSPGIVPLLKYLGLDSKRVMHDFGEQIGRNAASRMSNLSLRQMLEEFSRIWDAYRIGQLTVEGTSPLVLQISNCAVCGQLPGTAEMYECSFHEGFFQGALSARMGASEPAPAIELRRRSGDMVPAADYRRRRTGLSSNSTADRISRGDAEQGSNSSLPTATSVNR